MMLTDKSKIKYFKCPIKSMKITLVPPELFSNYT